MSIDRAATLRQAEKLLRQGKLDQAIAEYLRLVEDQPADWNTANLLGDLYVRVGQPERAIEQFTRSAENLRREGFLPRASALYKKLLKLAPDSDRVLMQAGDLALEQNLIAEARACFSAAAAGRRRRGDRAGALEVVVRIGHLDMADVDARVAGARALLELGQVPAALYEFIDLALTLVEAGRDVEAVVPLREVVKLDPANIAVVKELVRILIARGLTSEAESCLTPDLVDADADLLMFAVRLRLGHGDTAAALEMATALVARDAAATVGLMDLGLSLAESQPDVAYDLVDLVVRTYAAHGSWPAAAEALERLVARVPRHVAALTRLVDVCLDGGLTDDVCGAQARLADAYLAAGAAVEARCVAEDLVNRQPWERAHLARLRAALAAEGIPDIERTLADWLAAPPPLDTTDDAVSRVGQEAQVVEVVVEQMPVRETDTAPPQTVSPPEADTSRNPHAIDLDLVFGRPMTSHWDEPGPVGHADEDLSPELDEAGGAGEPAMADIEEVFARLRDQAAHLPSDEAAEVAYTRGAAMFEVGEFDQAIEPLRTAARSPRRRFAAASLLAGVYQHQGRMPQAIEWLGHAVDAPGVTDMERFATLFTLAELLEQSGEPASALAVCLELQSDAGDYKDLAVRLERLSRTSGG